MHLFSSNQKRVFFFMYSITSKTIQTTFQYYTRIRKAEAFSASETTTYNILSLSTIIIMTMENVNRIEIRSHETTFPNLMETNSSKFGWSLCERVCITKQGMVWEYEMFWFSLLIKAASFKRVWAEVVRKCGSSLSKRKKNPAPRISYQNIPNQVG